MIVKGMQLVIRFVLFVLILVAGTASALVVGESPGTAMANLANVSVLAITRATTENVLYAALTGGNQPTGIYRSTDNGMTWQLVSSGPGAAINALAVHPTQPERIYAGTAGGALEVASSLWYSDDGGFTWRRFGLGLPASPYGIVPAVTALAVDRARPEILYVGTDGQGVYRFNVERRHYEPVGGLSLYNAYVRSLVVASDGKLYAVTNAGTFVHSGDVWQPLENLPELPVSLAVAPRNPQILYAGGSSIGISRSTDGGQSWQTVNNGILTLPGAALRVTALEVDENDANHVVAATVWGLGGRLVGSTLYESRSGGLSWVKVAEVQGIVHRVTFHQGALYAATSNGLVRLGDAAPPAPVPWLADWAKLRNPTGVQILVLILTLALAGLVLAWRREWFTRRAACSTC
ncbi:MAG: hypothetical protein NZ765_03705 [Anaerolineae bacterium]|nr:hypothetical protein [Anaerolineae bacterium]MDW8070927.1 hypothetical protein [Anaerolineae bacterium]